MGQSHTASSTASMGPRSFERGDILVPDLITDSVPLLQWGRALSSAETLRTTHAWPGWLALQWGRALSSAETPSGPSNGTCLFLASMGPRSFERGDWRGPGGAHGARQRFNGAALFRARRHLFRCSFASGDTGLQWGRALSSAETCTRAHTTAMACACFNGAALFRARRRPRPRGGRSRPGTLQWGRALSSAETRNPCPGRLFWPSFNGAALFRARRRLVWIEKTRGCDASMGPRSFERGDRPRSGQLVDPGVVLQWGRALSSAETSSRQATASSNLFSFNGAALFRARRPRILRR